MKDMKDVWKKFEESELTHSRVHHLMAIFNLLEQNGYARGTDVAEYLNITRGSASITLNKLKNKGFIEEDRKKFYQLTKKGQQVVNSVQSMKRIVKNFFTQVLKLSEDLAEEDACRIEHLLSQETGEKLFSFLGFFLSDDASAVKFRNDLEKFKQKCDSFENCEICQVECFYARSNQ